MNSYCIMRSAEIYIYQTYFQNVWILMLFRFKCFMGFNCLNFINTVECNKDEIAYIYKF